MNKAASTGVDLETQIAGQWLYRIGLVAMALGVSYFLKLAIDNDWIGPLGQVAIGLLFGTALLASTPTLLKRGHRYFANGMAGLGGTVLYLSLWAGGSYYHLILLGVAFALMTAVTAGMMAVALAMDSQRVAVMALLGGFISPALASSGHNAEVALFSYVAVLSAALLPIAWKKNWRWLDLPALLLTAVWFWLWHAEYYEAARRGVTAGFAALFFLEFLALPSVRAQRDGSASWSDVVLVPLNAGLWLIAFATLFYDARWTLTLIAAAMAALHLAVARIVPVREGRSEAKLLMAGVALALASAIVPIRLRGSWITIGWSVEAAVLMWAGFRARLQRARVFAFLLLAISGARVAFLVGEQFVSDAPPLFNSRFAAEAIAILAFGFAVWMAARHRDELKWVERMAFNVAGVLVNLLAVAALTEEIRYAFRSTDFTGSRNALAEGLLISLLWVVYASGLMAAGLRQKLASVRWQALALFFIAIFKVFFNDMSYLSGAYRVASSLALGAVLLAVSFLYQRTQREAVKVP